MTSKPVIFKLIAEGHVSTMEIEAPTFAETENPDIQSERSQSPEAAMNLLLRFETSSGPRTVIACSVPRQVAAEITEIMKMAGQHAEFVDRCSPLSVADRLMIKSLH